MVYKRATVVVEGVWAADVQDHTTFGKFHESSNSDSQFLAQEAIHAAEMFTPVETGVGMLLTHLAVSTLLLNNGDILSPAAILRRGTGIWKRLENIALLVGMAISIVVIDASVPNLAHLSVSNVEETAGWLLAAGACVGWGIRNANGCILEHIFCGIPILSTRSIVATVLAGITAFGVLNAFARDISAGQTLPTSYPSQSEAKVLSGITTIAFLVSLVLHYAFRATSYIRLVVAFVSGLEFGLGLIISGLATPGKVLGFFCLRDGSRFDPSLALLLPFGVLPTLIRLWLRGLNKPPKFDVEFHLETLEVTEMDWRFWLGAAVLGLGWSLTGRCLGPAILKAVVDPCWGCFWGGGFAMGYLLLP